MPPIFIEGKPLPRAENPPKWIWLEPVGPDETIICPKVRPIEQAPSGDNVGFDEEFDDKDSNFEESWGEESDNESGEEPNEESDEESAEESYTPRVPRRRLDAARTHKIVKDRIGGSVIKPKVKLSQGFHLPAEATYVLREWVDAHQDHPFPTREEKDQLMLESGLGLKSLNDWFSYHRRKHVKLRRAKRTRIKRKSKQ